MPNTKSAERRMRSSARKHARNLGVKTSLKTVEKRFLANVKAGKTDDAQKGLRETMSRLDKAAKSGVIPKGRADRKKSRLARRLKAVQPAPAA